MKILQISSVRAIKGKGYVTFGLGDDGRVYFWNVNTTDWVLEAAA